jgi:hypothetical protein
MSLTACPYFSICVTVPETAGALYIEAAESFALSAEISPGARPIPAR